MSWTSRLGSNDCSKLHPTSNPTTLSPGVVDCSNDRPGRHGAAGGVEKSLRETVRSVLLSNVVRMDGGGNGTRGVAGDAWRVMVLDGRATRVISSVVGMYDIMEGHVTVVEDLHKVCSDNMPSKVFNVKRDLRYFCCTYLLLLCVGASFVRLAVCLSACFGARIIPQTMRTCGLTYLPRIQAGVLDFPFSISE